jgi:RsiW-degrading membrane proteinase PrsW (M82 family)
MIKIYLAIMGLIYGGYVWLLNYRMSMSEVWQSKSHITPEDSVIIGQLGKWSERLEILFLLLFVGMVVFCFFKRRTERNIIAKFLVANAFLSSGIVMLSLVLHKTTSLTVMDLVLPIMNMFGMVTLLSIYLFLEWFIKYRSFVSRA